MKKVLIVVDYQKDFADKNGALSVPFGYSISENIQKLIDNNRYDEIIYTFDTHEKIEYENSIEKTEFGFPIHCEYKTKGWELFNIKPKSNIEFNNFLNNSTSPFEMISFENETFFTKNVFNIWDGNNKYTQWFEDKFNKEETIIEVVGLAYEFCVFMNVNGMLDRGYKVNILEDCIKSITYNGEVESRTKMISNGVVIINEGVESD
jgi:nicotinamidase-related amidase